MNGKRWRKWSGYPEKIEERFKRSVTEPGENVSGLLNSPDAASVTI